KEDKDKKIDIREKWTSPIVFRRASTTLTMCDDSKAFATEARRRVQLNRDKKFTVRSGDLIQIMGEVINGKTDDLTS
ncbi:metallohydrolase, partial [Pseudomonas aeruginosa]